MTKDKILHIFLIGAVALLAGATVYFRFIARPPDAFEDAFAARIGKFDLERSLQGKAEVVSPNSVRVPILIYHSVRPHTVTQSAVQKYYDVAPDALAQQMQYLKDHNYVVIGLDYLITALEQNIILPAKAVVLTFDDGWRNQFSYAFPLLRKYGYTATFFIFTDAVNSDYFLTWDQIRVMRNVGMTIGGHTKSHLYLPDITDPAVLREEIIAGKRIIEDQIGQKIDLFAYPYGHYSDRIISVVKEAGYKGARSTYSGITHAREDIFKLKGVEVTDNFDEFVNNLNY